MEPTVSPAQPAHVGPASFGQAVDLTDVRTTGAVLRSRRIAAGFKQNVFAGLLGVSARRLSEFETGQKRVPEAVWDAAVRVLGDARPTPRVGVEAALEDLHPHPLTFVRRLNGWTKAELARCLARVVGGGSDAGKVRRWERGVVPDMPTQHALADLLGVSTEQVTLRPWPGWLPCPGGADVESPWNAQGTMAALDATVGEAVMDRRAFLTLSTAAVSGVAQRWASLPSSPTGEVFTGGSADDLVRAFEVRLPWLRTRQDELGSGAALNLLDSELRTAAVMLGQSLSESSGRRMAGIAAELARLAGQAGVDLGMASAAERYFVTGLRAAYDANDRIAGADIIKSWGLLLVECGRLLDAQVLLTVAHEAANTAPPQLRAMLPVREARVQASLGNRSDCDVLLAQSGQLLREGVNSDDHAAAVGVLRSGGVPRADSSPAAGR